MLSRPHRAPSKLVVVTDADLRVGSLGLMGNWLIGFKGGATDSGHTVTQEQQGHFDLLASVIPTSARAARLGWVVHSRM